MLTAIQVTTPDIHIRLRDRLRMRPRLLGVLVAVVFFWEGMGGLPDHRQVGGYSPDAARGLQTVHLGHLHVHKNHIESL